MTSNGDVNPQEKVDFLTGVTNKDYAVFYESDAEHTRVDVNQISEFSANIFLNRNLEKMRKHRNPNKIQRKNGLITHLVPLMQQITYEQDTEDTMHLPRQSLLGKRRFSLMQQDLKFS